MMEAIVLEKLVEDKFNAQWHQVKKPFVKLQEHQATPKPNRSLIVKWISPKEIKEHREKGLCYNCDENYDTSHRCITQKLYLLNVDAPNDEEDEVIVEKVENELDNNKDVVSQISYNALLGISSLQIMKYHGFLKIQSLIILIDSRSTHNFIDQIGQLLHIPQNKFEVMIINRGKIACKGKYHNVKLTMGDYQM